MTPPRCRPGRASMALLACRIALRDGRPQAATVAVNRALDMLGPADVVPLVARRQHATAKDLVTDVLLAFRNELPDEAVQERLEKALAACYDLSAVVA